jgi:hypothetical protein
MNMEPKRSLIEGAKARAAMAKEGAKKYLKGAGQEVKSIIQSQDKPTLIQRVKKSEKVQKLVTGSLAGIMGISAAFHGAQSLDATNKIKVLDTESRAAIELVQTEQSKVNEANAFVESFQTSNSASEVRAAMKKLYNIEVASNQTRLDNQVKEMNAKIAEFNSSPEVEEFLKKNPGTTGILLPIYSNENIGKFDQHLFNSSFNGITQATFEKRNDTFAECLRAIDVMNSDYMTPGMFEVVLADIDNSRMDGIGDGAEYNTMQTNNNMNTRKFLAKLLNKGPEFSAMSLQAQNDLLKLESSLNLIKDPSSLRAVQDKSAMVSITQSKMGPGLKQQKDSEGQAGVLFGLGAGVAAGVTARKKNKGPSNLLNSIRSQKPQEPTAEVISSEPIDGFSAELDLTPQLDESMVGQVIPTEAPIQPEIIEPEEPVTVIEKPATKVTPNKSQTPKTPQAKFNAGKLGILAGTAALGVAATFAGPKIAANMPSLGELNFGSPIELTSAKENTPLGSFLTPSNSSLLRSVYVKYNTFLAQTRHSTPDVSKAQTEANRADLGKNNEVTAQILKISNPANGDIFISEYLTENEQAALEDYSDIMANPNLKKPDNGFITTSVDNYPNEIKTLSDFLSPYNKTMLEGIFVKYETFMVEAAGGIANPIKSRESALNADFSGDGLVAKAVEGLVQLPSDNGFITGSLTDEEKKVLADYVKFKNK